ncbi:precorrin-2 C(20)-methyltransferase [Xanthovirga aplysinae]|uniref:precorrin-2 C(20)-methyltransferase n=1 Tax=Xanthovirga aplysinae TaxID=2529853 RepID=UPI0012BD35D6|nr:precorrin-2 C(20)-methyltransferase [Xanthovirga aplysinae]MTI33556.1 hypothetical protein [Xanthovirga aplysinae]
MNHKIQPIHALALGPGDPDLLTLKAFKLLQNADQVFVPGSINSNGIKSSFSGAILDELNVPDEKRKYFFIPMDPTYEESTRIYANSVDQIVRAQAEGKRIVVVCEGDTAFYASTHYLSEYLLEKYQQKLQIIPGISSFSYLATKVWGSMVLKDETFKILPLLKDINYLKAALKENKTVVLMKSRKIASQLVEWLSDNDFDFAYGERLGTQEEFISTDLNEIKKRKQPYFSLWLIRNRNGK